MSSPTPPRPKKSPTSSSLSSSPSPSHMPMSDVPRHNDFEMDEDVEEEGESVSPVKIEFSSKKRKIFQSVLSESFSTSIWVNDDLIAMKIPILEEAKETLLADFFPSLIDNHSVSAVVNVMSYTMNDPLVPPSGLFAERLLQQLNGLQNTSFFEQSIWSPQDAPNPIPHGYEIEVNVAQKIAFRMVILSGGLKDSLWQSETYVDSLVSTLLSGLGFDDFPLSLFAQPPFPLYFNSHGTGTCASAKADFGVFNAATGKHMLVVEHKLKNPEGIGVTAYPRAMAEAVAVAQKNMKQFALKEFEMDPFEVKMSGHTVTLLPVQSVYVIIVTHSVFQFFRVSFSPSTLIAISQKNEVPPTASEVQILKIPFGAGKERTKFDLHDSHHRGPLFTALHNLKRSI